MNKSLTLRNAVLLSFFTTTLFTACSKSTDDIADVSANKSEITTDRAAVTLTDAPNDGTDDRTFGSVKLTVTPSGDVGQIILYNDNYTSDAFVFDPNTGEFQLNDVPTGTYSVVIVPNNDNYRKSNTDNIGITENNISDLGNIILQN